MLNKRKKMIIKNLEKKIKIHESYVEAVFLEEKNDIQNNQEQYTNTADNAENTADNAENTADNAENTADNAENTTDSQKKETINDINVKETKNESKSKKK